MKTYLQTIINGFSYDNLPSQWQGFDLGRFSPDKALFDFQQEGLKSGIKALHKFYREKQKDKYSLYSQYRANGLSNEFDYNLKKKQDSRTAKLLLEYDRDYPAIDDKISFAYFINRMSFWMATGSGKTLIIVKLIDLLSKLMQRKEIPQNDILFLAHKDDLLEQFKKHIDEFNSFNFESRINLKSLKDFEKVKRDNVLPYAKNEITVFYYRSDLISDEHKEKIVNYRNYDNFGKWYILLDEAHKGDKEDSKRQVLYSILSRNGFLFNFSATFTDARDYATCAFNFNLAKFIEQGYGKHIYISDSAITAFKDKDDFSRTEKQKIILKTLILQTYINKFYEKIKKIDGSVYHRPLLLTLVNSVDTDESDLKLFFAEIEKAANNEIKDGLLEKAKQDILRDFEQKSEYVFEGIKIVIDRRVIEKIEYKDILKYVFNSKSCGKIEVLKIPGNKNEIIFKLQSSDKPFGLIKIGDISGWLKDKLSGYEINESFDNESIFKQLNTDDSQINILMGSRAFYEGWDSNRPNIVLFVNIGVGSDAKKFVLQSIGRGVRIEPLKNKRKRLANLLNSGEISQELFDRLKPFIDPLESLFVFGTNAENLKEIVRTLKYEKQETEIGSEFEVNKDAANRLLLVPVYRQSAKIIAEESQPQKLKISRKDFDSAKRFFDYMGQKTVLMNYECEPDILLKAAECFEKADKYFDFREERDISDSQILLGKILDYLNIRITEFDKFKKLENEIVHFRKIKLKNGDNAETLISQIRKIKKYPEDRKNLEKAFKSNQLTFDDFLQKSQELKITREFEQDCKKLSIKYVPNHYYIPMMVSQKEKIDYITHIIDVPSEIEFVKQLDEYLNKPDNIFKRFDWWMFSKLDETLDEIYIPYYNSKGNAIAKFKPDFIFWLQKGNDYQILFVDPKGTEHTDGYKKIDGYSNIFEQSVGNLKRFEIEGVNLTVKLLLMPSGGNIAKVPNNYKKYWFDNFSDFSDKLQN